LTSACRLTTQKPSSSKPPLPGRWAFHHTGAVRAAGELGQRHPLGVQVRIGEVEAFGDPHSDHGYPSPGADM